VKIVPFFLERIFFRLTSYLNWLYLNFIQIQEKGDLIAQAQIRRKADEDSGKGPPEEPPVEGGDSRSGESYTNRERSSEEIGRSQGGCQRDR
jgi:hypothetical protein